MRQELEKLVEQLSRIEGVTDLTLTTNGYLLPNVARSLKEAGLERITVSLDSLDEDVFKALNGRRFGVEKVLEASVRQKRPGSAGSRSTRSSKRG